MTPTNIQAGFNRTGIWPINRAAIPSYVSEPSKVSEFRFRLLQNVGKCSVCYVLLWLCYTYTSGFTKIM